MTLDEGIAAETEAQIARLAPYAERRHSAAKHPAPGCSCHACEPRRQGGDQ